MSEVEIEERGDTVRREAGAGAGGGRSRASDEEIEQAFIAAIAKNPDDEDAREVYADWLEQRGDPRGEYLRLDLQLIRIPLRLTALAAAISPSWLDVIARRYDVALTKIGVNKIACIKVVREITGVGLRDALQIVEAVEPAKPYILRERLERGPADAVIRLVEQAGSTAVAIPHSSKATSVGLETDVVMVGLLGSRTAAIKLLRELTGLGLLEARDRIADTETRGARFTLARAIDATRAIELAARCTGVLDVVLERSFPPPAGQGQPCVATTDNVSK